MKDKYYMPDGSLHEECVGCYNFQCGYIIRPNYCNMECVSYSYTDKSGKDHFNKRFPKKCYGQKWKQDNVEWIESLQRCGVLI